jgi:hypothetical protein
MIIGLKRGKGGKALGNHLADNKNHNETNELGSSRNLVSDNIREQINELEILSSMSQSKKPLYHIHADPSIKWSSDEWRSFWDKFEKEFGLESQPYAEIQHEKKGRIHKHRVYSLYDTGTQKTKNTAWDYSRAEKIARIMELETGEKLTAGKHTKSIIKHNPGLAESLAPIADMKVKSAFSPSERQQEERTGIKKADVARIALESFEIAKSGAEFRRLINDNELEIRLGEKSLLLVDKSGNIHELSRMLKMASKGVGKKISNEAIVEKLGNLQLEQHIKGDRPLIRKVHEMEVGEKQKQPFQELLNQKDDYEISPILIMKAEINNVVVQPENILEKKRTYDDLTQKEQNRLYEMRMKEFWQSIQEYSKTKPFKKDEVDYDSIRNKILDDAESQYRKQRNLYEEKLKSGIDFEIAQEKFKLRLAENNNTSKKENNRLEARIIVKDRISQNEKWQNKKETKENMKLIEVFKYIKKNVESGNESLKRAVVTNFNKVIERVKEILRQKEIEQKIERERQLNAKVKSRSYSMSM